MPDIRFGGGLNTNSEFDVQLEECIDGENFLLNYQRREFRPRPPQVLMATAPTVSTDTAAGISGIMQLELRTGTITTLIAAGDADTIGTVYSWDGSTTFTNVGSYTPGSRLISTYWSLDDFIVITDTQKLTPVKKWDGTTLSRLLHGIRASTSTQTVPDLTQTGGVATASLTAHGLSTGDIITISGANETEYNIQAEISTSNANNFSYTVAAGAASPATGTILVTKDPDVYARYAVVFNNRLWLFNIKEDATLNEHVLWASAFEDETDFDNSSRAGSSGFSTGEEAFFMTSPDLREINGVTVFNDINNNQDILVFSTHNGRLFKLTGADSTDYRFVEFYPNSDAAGTLSLVNMGNDVAYLKSGGIIESVSSTNRFGDVAADDLSRWVPDQFLGQTDSIAIYDQLNQRVVWFLSDKVMVLDKNVWQTTEWSPWMKWTTKMSNNFVAQAAAYIKNPLTSRETVIWGDADGKIFDLNGTVFDGDEGTSDITTFRKNSMIVNNEGDLLGGRIIYQRKGAVNAQFSFDWIENYAQGNVLVPLLGPLTSAGTDFWGGAASPVYWSEGDDYWSEGGVSENKISTLGLSPSGRSPGYFLTTSLTTTVNFLISRLLL